MSDYFLLEAYVHDLTVGGGLAESGSPSPLALAFQFLDYPILLSYAKQDSPWSAEDVVQFSSGKSCILQEDLEELQYVLQKVLIVAMHLGLR